MMRLTVFGEMNKMDAKQFKKEMAELKPGEGVSIGDTKYEYGADLHTDGTPLIDPGGGPANVIRTFNFKIDPRKIRNFPDRQTLFNSHAKQIQTILWADGLRPLENINPRVIINIKKMIYHIFVSCEASKGVIFSEKDRNPELLHKQLNRPLDKPKRN